MLKRWWNNIFKFNWQFGLTLILALGILRFILVLQANKTGSYGLVSIVFLLMCIIPFVVLSKEGRRFIGLKRSNSYLWLLGSFALGILFCSLVQLAGLYLYGGTLSNWFVYISRSYSSNIATMSASDKHIYFLIYSLIAMTFSPIGEELFYRGVVHESFVNKFGERGASNIDSLAFALTHLAHFGIVYISGNWRFLFIPALIWVLLMFCASKLFFWCKQKTGSLLGAIICHAGFNFAMMYFIFYHIL